MTTSELVAGSTRATGLSAEHVVTRNKDGSPLSRAGDRVWDFYPHRQQPNQRRNKFMLDFGTTLTEQWLTSIRERLIIRWEGKNGEVPAKPATVITIWRSLRLLAKFAELRQIHSPEALKQSDMDAFADLLKSDRTWDCDRHKNGVGRQRGDVRLIRIITDCCSLWTHRNALSIALSFNPWNGTTIRKAIGLRHSSDRHTNKTPPIPSEVFRPFFHFCWKYVSLYSADILAMADSLAAVEERIAALGRCVGTVRANRLSVLRNSTKFLQDPDSRKPWRSAWASYYEFERDLIALIVSCEVVINFLSGARPGECCAFEEGCVAPEKRDEGVLRYRVRGLVFKGRLEPTPAEWLIIEEAAKAIETLKQATRRRRRKTSTKILFVTSNGTPYSDDDYSWQLNKHRRYLNDRLGAKIPDYEGKPWVFAPRQFRRTCARYIAREPFGIVAGARQFKQVSIEVFEGYANYEIPEHLREFRQEIDEELLLAQEDWRDEIVDAAAGGGIAGPAGRELERDFNGLVVDKGETEARRLLKGSLHNVYVGKYNFCRFRRESALCLKVAAEPERNDPIIGLCDEGRCPNSCITKRHAPAWRVVRQDMRWAKTQAPPGSRAKVVLRSEIDRIGAVLKPLEKLGE